MPRFSLVGAPAVSAESLGKVLGTTIAVDDLTLDIEAGEVFGLLGPGGSGKTTALRMLAGMLPPTTGRVTITGLDPAVPAEARQIRSIVGFLPEGPGPNEEMTVPELLAYFTKLQRVLGVEHAARIQAVLTTLHLWEGQPDRAASRSVGLRQRLALARALTHNPSIVFLDEPTARLDPEDAETVHELIADLRTQGRTVVLTTSDFSETMRLCDRVAVIQARVLTVAAPRQLRGTLPMGI